MNERSHRDQAVELLQELGLKEYEARSFVALARRRHGTAKEISNTSDVPRTRAYDAVRVLESKGLVEIQHSNPQLFRAVPIDEAVKTLQSEYVDRTESLRDALSGLEPPDSGTTTEVTHEVWSISGDQGITNRAYELIDGATEEVLLVLGSGTMFTDELTRKAHAAEERGVNVVIGTVDDELRTTVEEALPDVEVFVSGLEWLSQSPLPDDETEITRLLLADREAILVSSITDSAVDRQEKGVFGRGFDNGLVTIVRRLMVTGLLVGDDPEVTTE